MAWMLFWDSIGFNVHANALLRGGEAHIETEALLCQDRLQLEYLVLELFDHDDVRVFVDRRLVHDALGVVGVPVGADVDCEMYQNGG